MSGAITWAALAMAAALHAQAPARLSAPLPMTPAAGPIFTGDPRPEHSAELQAAGYVEQEYLVSGRVAGRPYTTTLLIRRPRDPRRFSGLVVVEAVHVGGGSELWRFADVITAGGHGYALVGAQRSPIDRSVRPLNPTRYAAVSLPAGPEPAEPPRLAGALAGAPPDLAPLLRAVQAEAPIAHEVLAQVGARLKANGPDPPFGGRVRWLITGGVSQTGQLTLTYLRGTEAEATTAAGAPIFDGFFPTESTGEGPVPPHAGKVIQAVGEADVLNFASDRGLTYRRADSDAAGDQFRLYEVAGASHTDTRGRGRSSSPELEALFARGERPSQFPARLVYATALQNLIDWVAKGRPPPRAARLQLAGDGAIARDSWGNALGGVRTSSLDVPVARYVAVAPRTAGPQGFNRRFYGLQIPLPDAALRRLYPSHADYVAKVRADLRRLTAGRWITPFYAADLLAEARAAPVPPTLPRPASSASGR